MDASDKLWNGTEKNGNGWVILNNKDTNELETKTW